MHELKKANARLVDAENDGPTVGLRHDFEHLHDVHGRCTVEPRGRLVEEEHGGIVNNVDPDGHPPPLPARDSSIELVANSRVRCMLQPQLGHDGFDSGQFFRIRNRCRESQPCAEEESFHDRQAGEQGVVLHDITRNTLELVHIYHLIVDEDASRRTRGSYTARQYLEQCRLACTAGPCHCQKLSGLRFEVNIPQNIAIGFVLRKRVRLRGTASQSLDEIPYPLELRSSPRR
ncbi:hypothetical protein Mapa_004006 [Marchantia paleacea]|nr:hypothetical protein Mapa_004006 [Marchantia paleacea]